MLPDWSEGADEVQDCHENVKARHGLWHISLVLLQPVLQQVVAMNGQERYPDECRTHGERVGQHESHTVDSPQAEGQERKLFFVDESQEECEYRHVPEGLGRLVMVDMGMLVPVAMGVIMVGMVMRMPVGLGIGPVGHVKKQENHAVPNDGQG